MKNLKELLGELLHKSQTTNEDGYRDVHWIYITFGCYMKTMYTMYIKVTETPK